jgi:hypothetical protein
MLAALNEYKPAHWKKVLKRKKYLAALLFVPLHG